MNDNKDLVLIVDDSLTVRMDLREALVDAGFATMQAASLSDARAAIALRMPDIVVLDRVLPDGDGASWLAELRARPGGASVIVLLLSTESEAGDRARGLMTGADEYVGKPYDRSYVIGRACELLRLRHGRLEPDRSTVLVIDDSETYREALREALENAGYKVSVAAGGEEGLRAAAALRPSVMIVDMQMPDLDGAGVIRRLRLDPALRSTPCLLLTSDDGIESELRALDAGADAFVRKQEELELLLARLAAVLRSAMASAQPEPGSSLLDPKRILAADDSATFLAELSSQLRDEGYDVLAATSGEQALELLAVQSVDAVLMDLQMPGIGGLEACRRIKSAPALRDIPVVMLTGLDDRQAMLAGLEAGADDYVVKSGETELLKARLRAQLRRKQIEDEARRAHAELHSNALEAAESRAARALADSRAELLAMLQQKNEALEKANAELLSASSAKTDFMSTMSHELRTPLNAVIGFSAILRDGVAGALSPRQAEFANHIHDAGKHLLALVNDILDLAKIEAGRVDLEFEAIELDPLLDDALVIVRERAKEQGIAIELRGLGPKKRFGVDRRRFKQIAYNLLSNAVKFTPSGGSVTVEARIVDRAAAATATPGFADGYRRPLPENEFERFLQLSVTDTGVGMDTARLAQLFRPFTQLKSEQTRDIEGTGLGLATVARLAELHGGTVAVSSEVGVGSCFTCWLPWRDAATAGGAGGEAESPGEKPLALVIEDNEQAAFLMRTQLEASGFQVHLAESAEAALGLFGKVRPDLITLDIQLPGLDGWELLSRLKNLPGWAHVPVVVVSVDAQHEVGLSLGASAVLHKPVSRAVLSQELELLGFKAGSTKRCLVLVVSDEPGELQLISSYLKQPGFSVLRAFGGQEGIDLARRYAPDLIVLDLLMNDVTGIEVVEALRQDNQTAGIPVIVLAAKQLSDADRKLLNAHVQASRERAHPANGGHFIDEVKRAFSRSTWGELD